MKIYLRIVVASILLSSCSWLSPRYRTGLENRPLPEFSLMRQDSVTIFNTANIPGGSSFIVLLFRPDCPYCNDQIKIITANIAAFKKIPIYLVTSYPYQSIKQFSGRYHLERYPNITLLRDSSSHLLHYFNNPGVPCWAFYDHQRKLEQVLIGRREIDILRKSIPD